MADPVKKAQQDTLKAERTVTPYVKDLTKLRGWLLPFTHFSRANLNEQKILPSFTSSIVLYPRRYFQMATTSMSFRFIHFTRHDMWQV